MQKLGISLQTNYTAPMEDILRLVHAAGFCAISPVWTADTDLEHLVKAAEKRGLAIQSLHGPYRGLPGMWSREDPAPILQELMTAADNCREYGIPVMVVHPWVGIDYTFDESKLSFDRFDRLIERAQRNGIQIAFENLEGPEYLAAVMERYRDPETVGFCWDSGHQLCYAPQRDFLKDYGERLLMTHLNDNLGISRPDGQLLGTDDLHLLPYDGKADWTCNIARLKQARTQEFLNFELKIRPKGDRCTTDLYSKMPLEEYFTEAGNRARKIAQLYCDPAI